jgi:hypothetical protein
MIALDFVAEILTQGVCKKRKLARWRMKMSVYIMSSNSSTQSHARGWQRRDSEKSVK